jgi:hypothetical protein
MTTAPAVPPFLALADFLTVNLLCSRGDRTGGRVTALVSKRDRVLANGIEQAVQRGESLDGLTSRKSDYHPGGRLHGGAKKKKGPPKPAPSPGGRRRRS